MEAALFKNGRNFSAAKSPRRLDGRRADPLIMPEIHITSIPSCSGGSLDKKILQRWYNDLQAHTRRVNGNWSLLARDRSAIVVNVTVGEVEITDIVNHTGFMSIDIKPGCFYTGGF